MVPSSVPPKVDTGHSLYDLPRTKETMTTMPYGEEELVLELQLILKEIKVVTNKIRDEVSGGMGWNLVFY